MKQLFWVAFTLVFIFAQDVRSASRNLMIFAGAASRPATEEVIKAFKQKTGVGVDVTFGGSGFVLSQMKLAQKGDLYFPGSSDFMETAKKEGLVFQDSEKIIVYLVPAINVQKGNPKQIYTLRDLAKDGVRVAIANPPMVCVGTYAVEIIEKNLSPVEKERLRKNLVNYTESCEKTASVISLRAVDAVLGWEVFQYWDPDRIETVYLKPEEIPRIGYIPIAISKFVKDKILAQEFIDFLLSSQGKAAFQKYHYLMDLQEARRFTRPNTPVGGGVSTSRGMENERFEGDVQMSFRHTMLGAAVCLFIFYLGLLFSLFYFVNAKGFWEVLIHPGTLFAIKLSVTAATLSTFFAVVIGLPAAYALSRFEFPGKRIIDTFLEIPMIMSPIALGASLLIFFNTPLGEVIQKEGIFFVFEVPGIILAQFATIAGLATRLIKASLDEISPRYEAVARSLGSSSWQAFYRITLPLALRGLIASVILSWAKALGEFGATVTLAGAMPGKTETMPIAIFSALASANIDKTIVLILILAAFGLCTLYCVRLTGERRRYD